jgi:hypothetical protein
LKVITFAQGFGSGKHVSSGDFIAQAGEFGIGQMHTVKRLEFLAEVLF